MYNEDWIIDIGGWKLAVERTFSGDPAVYQTTEKGNYEHINGGGVTAFNIVYNDPHVVIFTQPYPYNEQLNLEINPWKKLPAFNPAGPLQFEIAGKRYEVLQESNNYPTLYITPSKSQQYYYWDGSINVNALSHLKPSNFKNTVHIIILAKIK